MFTGQLLFLLYLQKQGSSILWTQQGSYTQLTAGMTAHTNPVEAQARPNLSKKRKPKHTFPPVAEKLLATGSCWKKKRSFSQKCSQVSQPLSSVRPQHLNSTTQLFKNVFKSLMDPPCSPLFPWVNVRAACCSSHLDSGRCLGGPQR